MSSYPILNLGQTHPFFGGLGQGLQLAQEGIKAYHLPKTLREKLKKMQMENEFYPETMQAQNRSKNAYADLISQQSNWYGPKAQSDIAYQGMQGQHLGAQNALLGEQTNELGAENSRKKRILDIYREMANSQQGMTPQEDYNPSQTSLGEMQQGNPQILQQAFDNLDRNGLETTGANLAMAQEGINNPITGKQIPVNNNTLPMTGPQAKKLSQLQSELGMLQDMPMKARAGETLAQKEEIKEEHAIKKEDRTVYRKLSENSNKVAKDAKMMSTLVDQFEDAYNKTKFKGPVKGMIPGKLSDANARIADNAAMNMQSIAAKMLGASKLTNYELKFAGNLKLNREMGHEDARILADFMKAKTNRIEEEQKFLNNAKEKGIPPEKAEELWNKYDNEKPVYNFENRKINKDNLGKSREYLNPTREYMQQDGGNYSQEDLEHTAKLRGITVEEVKRMLGGG